MIAQSPQKRAADAQSCQIALCCRGEGDLAAANGFSEAEDINPFSPPAVSALSLTALRPAVCLL